jgi:hypothetical protein
MVVVAGAAGSGQSAALLITNISGTQLTLQNPTPPPAIPLASPSGAGLLATLSGSAGDFVDGTNTCQTLTPVIWSVRLRNFSSIGNPTFEVDQRNVLTSVPVATGTVSVFTGDRWQFQKSTATATFSTQQLPGGTTIPGTNFRISGAQLNVTLTAAQASLAAGDYITLTQNVEGPCLRELINDAHSISLLVKCSSAPVTFCVRLMSPAANYNTLIKAFTILVANQWTLITLPALPVFPPGGTWVIGPGGLGYYFTIGLGAGSTFTAPANDTWQNGNFLSGPGITNFASLPVNTVFSVCMVQHEPGAVCSQLMDKPFTGANGNYEECLRYFQKSYSYPVKNGTTNSSAKAAFAMAGQHLYLPIIFPKIMAKSPTVLGYSDITGASNNVRDLGSSIDRAISGSGYTIDSGFGGFFLGTTNSLNTIYTFHYTADTGW